MTRKQEVMSVDQFRAAQLAGMSEKELQRIVTDLAWEHGWRVATFRAGRVLRGGVEKYETPVGADGKGWPDIVAIHPDGTLLVAELKAEGGKVRPEQQIWLDCFVAVPGAIVRIWRPRDMAEIEAILTRKA